MLRIDCTSDILLWFYNIPIFVKYYFEPPCEDTIFFLFITDINCIESKKKRYNFYTKQKMLTFALECEM